MWLAIKSKLALIVGAIIGILLLYIGALKRIALQRELDHSKAVSKGRDKANEALIKGVENESKPIHRGYFDNSD